MLRVVRFPFFLSLARTRAPSFLLLFIERKRSFLLSLFSSLLRSRPLSVPLFLLLPFSSCSHLCPSVPSSSFPHSATTLQPSAHVFIHSRGYAARASAIATSLEPLLSRPSPSSRSPTLIQRYPVNWSCCVSSNEALSSVRLHFCRPLAGNLNSYRETHARRKFSEQEFRLSLRDRTDDFAS